MEADVLVSRVGRFSGVSGEMHMGRSLSGSVFVDCLCAGGLSILAYGLCLYLADSRLYLRTDLDARAIAAQIAFATFCASFVANFPHFLISYQLIYGDYRQKLFGQWSYFFAGIAVPAVLLAICVAIVLGRTQLFFHFIHLMYLSVAWHYVRQVYGVVVVTSSRAGVFFNSLERNVLNAALLSLAIANTLYRYDQAIQPNFFGIAFANIAFPLWAFPLAESVAIFFAVVVIAGVAWKWARERVVPAPAGVVALVSIYVWYVPVLDHAVFSHLAPFFHSLQYLWIVWVFRWRKVQASVRAPLTLKKRVKFASDFGSYIVLSMILGAAFFYYIPYRLDLAKWIEEPALRATGFAALFAAFINIHHFFIDAVIWRKDNPEVGQFLVRRDSSS